MEREKVIELAKKAKLAAYEDEILEFARLVEQETLERAAKLCDVQKEKNIDYANEYDEKELESLGFWSRVSALDGVSRLIRNLKDDHDKE